MPTVRMVFACVTKDLKENLTSLANQSMIVSCL